MKKPEDSYHKRMENEKPILTFACLGDFHQSMPWMDKKLNNACKDMKEHGIQYLILTGDLTQNAQRFQFKTFFDTILPYDLHLITALGNHDMYHKFEDPQLKIYPELKEHVFQHGIYHKEIIEGCSFYVLNTQKQEENNIYFEKDQLAWLETELQRDQNEWKFVICHHPLANTHPYSVNRIAHVGFQNAKLEEILKTHEVCYVSSHLHNSYSLTAMTKKHDIVCINVPSFRKIEHGIKKEHITLELQVYRDFLYGHFRCHDQQCYMESVEYFYEKKQKQLLIVHPSK